MEKYRLSSLTVEEFNALDDHEDAMFLDAAIDIIRDYHLHKNKKRLADAVRNGTATGVIHKILEEPKLRNLIADVLEGTYKPSKGGHRKRETINKHNKIFTKFNYYRAMGIPIDGGDMSCVSLVSEEFHIGEYTLVKEILGRGNYDPSLSQSPLSMGWVEGTEIKLMNLMAKEILGIDGEEPPKSIEAIRELEKMFNDVLDDRARREIEKEAMRQVMEMSDSYKNSDVYRKVVGGMLKKYIK